MSSIHEETMDSLFDKLPELDEHQRKVIRRLTKSIVNQMTTDPINRIKEMAGTKQGDEALRMFTQIFALEDAVETAAEKVTQELMPQLWANCPLTLTKPARPCRLCPAGV